MINDLNIIAIRKQDVVLAHQAFKDLMQKTEIMLNDDAKKRSFDYKSLTASGVESVSVDIIRKACDNTPFNPHEVKLVSGQRFPDIIAEKYYGVEVKTTKDNHWTSTGSSIMESTRDVNVEDIYMLFGKMGGLVPEFKCRPYEEVLYDIAVTHSPRYLIDMEIGKEETIFAKMNLSYNDFRKSSDAIDKVRRYYREKARKAGKQEMPWWITSENVDSAVSFNIRLWNTLSCEEKKFLIARSMILFPEVLNPKIKQDKYNQVSLWLCSYQQVVVPNIRDSYSAGGKITHVDGNRLKVQVSQVFKRIVDYADEIKNMLNNPSSELLMLIKDYNPMLLRNNNLYENWLSLCIEIADENKVPLKQWIDKKPNFVLSKH